MMPTNSPTPDRLQEMLHAQRELQELINGYSLDEQTNEQRIANIKENVLALAAELFGEVLGEVGWKSWATSRHINRDALVKELIDVWHFLMNLMLHADMTADELYEGYLKKREINIRRQCDGYDGVSTKCPRCLRALEDVVIKEIYVDGGKLLFQCSCGANLDVAVVAQVLGDN